MYPKQCSANQYLVLAWRKMKHTPAAVIIYPSTVGYGVHTLMSQKCYLATGASCLTGRLSLSVSE
jgi:hypothetical protein